MEGGPLTPKCCPRAPTSHWAFLPPCQQGEACFSLSLESGLVCGGFNSQSVAGIMSELRPSPYVVQQFLKKRWQGRSQHHPRPPGLGKLKPAPLKDAEGETQQCLPHLDVCQPRTGPDRAQCPLWARKPLQMPHRERSQDTENGPGTLLPSPAAQTAPARTPMAGEVGSTESLGLDHHFPLVYHIAAMSFMPWEELVKSCGPPLRIPQVPGHTPLCSFQSSKGSTEKAKGTQGSHGGYSFLRNLQPSVSLRQASSVPRPSSLEAQGGVHTLE